MILLNHYTICKKTENFINQKGTTMDINDRNDLVVKNADLVHKYIHKYYPDYEDNEDVISQGYLGLVKASRKYKDEYKEPFRTFARHYMRSEINQYLKNEINYNTNTTKLNNVVIDGYDCVVFNECTLVDLDKILLKISERNRSIVKLRAVDNLTFSEIAKIYNISNSYAQQCYTNSLRQLRWRSGYLLKKYGIGFNDIHIWVE